MQPSRISIAGLGDSLTYGWSVAVGFFDRAIDLLSADLDELEIQSRNLGVPGDTAAGGLSRISALLGQGHCCVTVQFGINDAYCGESVEKFHNNCKEITRQIIDDGSIPILVVSCPLFGEERLITPYYDSIRSVARTASAPLADLDQYWRAVVSKETRSVNLFLEDGVHPTDAGHALMAQGLVEQLKFCCKPKKDQ